MFISQQQARQIFEGAEKKGLNKNDVMTGLVKKGYEFEGFDSFPMRSAISNQETLTQTEGNQFEREPKGFFAKARDFAGNLVGGMQTAIGGGMALAAPEVQENLSKVQADTDRLEVDLMNRIKQKEQSGEDTTRLQTALQTVRATRTSLADAQADFVGALPSDRAVLGSSARLATSLITPTVTKGYLAGKPATTGFAEGFKRLAPVGAAEGALQSVGVAAEQDMTPGQTAATVVGGTALGGLATGLVGGVSSRLRASQELKRAKENLIKSRPDSTVAQYTLDGQGKLTNDKVAREVIKQGVDEGTVATIKGSSQADKKAMTKALDILEKADADKKFAALNRSSDVVGETAMSRFKAVNQINRQAGKQLDDIAKSLRGNQVDPIPAVRAFADDLADLGVIFKNGKAVYSGSQIEGVKPAQSLIDKVIKRINDVGDDAFQLHNLKKFLDEQVAFGKTAEGLSGRTESVVKSLRRNIDQLLDTNFPPYNEVNTQYSVTRNAIDDFLGAAGSKFDVTKPGAEKQVGTLMRRILSNAQSRVQVTNAMQNLQDVAGTFGKKFDDDVISQLVFVDELERLFGSQAPTSIQGIGEKVIKSKGLTGRMRSAEGIFDLALELGAEGIDKAKGVNQENLLKSLRQILSN